MGSLNVWLNRVLPRQAAVSTGVTEDAPLRFRMVMWT